MVQNAENLVFFAMFCMQHTAIRAKTIFLKSEIGCKSIKCNSFYEMLCMQHTLLRAKTIF